MRIKSLKRVKGRPIINKQPALFTVKNLFNWIQTLACKPKLGDTVWVGPDNGTNLIGLEAYQSWTLDTGQHQDVVKFPNRIFHPHPMHDVSVLEVNDK